MTKKFTIVLVLVCACYLLNAQGVKQLWALHGFNGQLFSLDTARGNYIVRKQFGGYGGLIDFKVVKGKIYGTREMDWFLYEFDPISNILTDRVPIGYFEGVGADLAPVSHLTVKNNTLFGVTSLPIRTHTDPENTTYDNVPIYSWNTDSQEFTEIISGTPPELFGPIGSMTEWNGKFYGLTKYGNSPITGTIYEFDPSNNSIRTVLSFEGIQLWNTSYDSYRSLTLVGNKFYCMGLNALFEWDPTGTTVEIKHNFDNPAEGINAVGSLVEKDGKLYGFTAGEELDNVSGALFEYDPATNNYEKKINLKDYNLVSASHYSLAKIGNSLYGIGQDITSFDPEDPNSPYEKLFVWNPVTNQFVVKDGAPFGNIRAFQVVPSPVSMFTPGSCASFPSVTVNASNNNQWVPITDSKGDVLAEIHPHGNNLGLVTAEAYINSGAVRTDGAGKSYLDRNMTITPENQPNPGNPVEVRLYITKREFETLKAAPSSGITAISDLAIFKNEEVCSGNITTATDVITTYEDYEFGYVLKAFIPSFSTFYFSKRVSEVLPLQLLDFSGTLQNNDVVLQWKTDNEHNTHSFDIERSNDGIHFSILGNVAANNTAGKHQYNFTDKDATELSASVLYYRLNQKDIDGKAKFSKIISIAVPVARLVSISPNPAGSFINVKLRKQLNTANTIIQVIDAGGRKVIEQKINPANNTHKINIIGLSKGVYMISIINNGERITSKFIKE